jgi:SnoaL-like domain
MLKRERVEEFVKAVVDGEYMRAITDFYHDDASMQENGGPLRKGRESLLRHEAGVLKRMKMATHPEPVVLVDGDRVAIQWIFDMTDPTGVIRRIEEVALQDWTDDRIKRERFFYDPSAAAMPLTAVK